MSQTGRIQITKEKISKERVLELVRLGTYVFCFTGVIIHLLEYDNQVFQTGKNTQNMIAMLFFVLLVTVAQRVKLFNWYSLAVTVIYIPLAFYQSRMYCALATDLAEYIVLEKVIIWIMLMVITDMMVTKRVRDIRTMNIPLVSLFAVSAVLLILFRDNQYSVLNYIVVLLLLFVSIDEKEWKRIIGGLFTAGGITFVLVVILSLVINPPVLGERWYGYFLNIGAFGEFMGLITVFAVLAIILSKEKFGRKSPAYICSWLWLFLALAIEALNGTTTFIIALGVLVIALLVFGFKKTAFPHLFLRVSAMIFLGICGMLLFLFAAEIIGNSVGLKDQIQASASAPILKTVSAGVFKVLDKVAGFRDSINGARADYIQSSALTFLHAFSSRRIGIFDKYLTQTTFLPNSGGVWFHGYFAYGAHNQFIQTLYENGYLVGGLNILSFITLWIASVIGYVRSKKNIYLVSLATLSMMFGMWMGEVCAITYPITFIALVLAVPALAWKLPEREDAAVKLPMADKRGKRIVLSSSLAIVCIATLFVIKLAAMNRNDVTGVEEYVVLSDNIVKDSAAEETGYIVFGQDYVLKNAKLASWGDRGYAVVPFRGINKEDQLILEFTAISNNDRPVEMKVCYEEEEEFVTLAKGENRFRIGYHGFPEDNNVVFIVEGQNGMDSPVVLSNIALVNCGTESP